MLISLFKKVCFFKNPVLHRLLKYGFHFKKKTTLHLKLDVSSYKDKTSLGAESFTLVAGGVDIQAVAMLADTFANAEVEDMDAVFLNALQIIIDIDFLVCEKNVKLCF
jgi:hypothetical protein